MSGEGLGSIGGLWWWEFQERWCWVSVGSQADFRRKAGLFSAGRKGEVAGGLGEIRGRILGCSGGVLGAGSLEEGEAEVRCLWVDFRREFDHSLARDCLWNPPLSFGINSSSSPLFPS